MPFQNLRVNNQFYILHKDGTPFVETGSVVGVSAPVPEAAQQPMMFGQPMRMVVDITVKVGEQTVTFQKIPAGADIADANFPGGGNMVISGSRESMNAEVTAMRTRSQEILKSIDYHRTMVESCNRMMETLNPELAERQRQDAENKALRQEISELKAMMAELLKPAEKASSNNSKKQQT